RRHAYGEPEGRALAHLLREPRGPGGPHRAHTVREIRSLDAHAAHRSHPGQRPAARLARGPAAAGIDLGHPRLFSALAREPRLLRPHRARAGAARGRLAHREEEDTAAERHHPHDAGRVLRLTASVAAKKVSAAIEATRLLGKWTKLAQ